MPKYICDFDLDCWVRCLEIEADSVEEAKEKLCKMTVEEIIEKGYIEDHSIRTLDIKKEEE